MAPTPVFKLTYDVLGLVFLTKPVSPVALSHVCQLWREVALSSPGLWNTILYPSPTAKPHPFNPITFFERVTTYLNRSGSSPLILSFDLREISPEIVLRTLSLILPHAHRWNRLYFFVTQGEAMLSIIRALEPLETPLLERLSIHYSNAMLESYASQNWGGDDRWKPMPPILCGGAPLLASFRATDFLIQPYPSLSNIRTLVIGSPVSSIIGGPGYSSTDLRNLLSLPHLECLHLCHLLNSTDPTWTMPRPLELPKLKHLFLGDGGGSSRLHWYYISAPNLLSLQLDMGHMQVPVATPGDFRTRSAFPNVIQLTISACSIEDRPQRPQQPFTEVQKFFSLFPNLRHLTTSGFVGSNMKNPVLPYLTTRRLGPPSTNRVDNSEGEDEKPINRAQVLLPELLTYTCPKSGSEKEQVEEYVNEGIWRPGLLVNPRERS